MNKLTMMRYVQSALMIVAMIVVLGGCEAKKDQSAVVPLTLQTAVSDLISNPTELSQAKEMLTVQCARALGFDMPSALAVSTSSKGYADVGGIFRSQAEAMAVGYPTVTVDYAKGVDTLDAYRDTLSESESDRFAEEVSGTLGGDPSKNTACWNQATRWLYGSWDNYTMLSNTFNEYGRSKSDTTLNDPDVVAAIRDEYMPCMAEYGYNVRGLRAYEIAQKEFGAYRMYNEPPDEREKTLARHDFDCQERAGLMDKLDAAMQRTAGKWMLENEAMLLERHELLEQAMGRAKQVIDGSVTYQTIDKRQ